MARAIVKNSSNGEYARARALQLIGEEDADAKTFAAKFKDDPQQSVKSAAERILKGEK